jgi:hypothetical protein
MMYIQIHIPHTYVCSMFPFRIFRRVRLEQSLDLMQGGLFVYIEASLDDIRIHWSCAHTSFMICGDPILGTTTSQNPETIKIHM